MKKTVSSITLVSLLCVSPVEAFSFKSLFSYFSPEKFEAVEQKEIPCSGHQTLAIETIKGPIHIQTWQQQKVLLKAIKRAAKEEMLPHMSIDTKSINDTLVIKTVYNENDTKGSIEYDLLVPASFNIVLKAQASPIKIEHVSGKVTIREENGDVELNAIHGPIAVEVTEKGSIVIEQPGNTVKAVTRSGSIDINDAQKSIFASTDNGKIRASCKNVPNGNTIKLDASGLITLQVPTDIHADVQAETEKGGVLCEHYLTVKPFVTQLNAEAWNHFKRNINGSIGKGGSQICLHSVSGNIKITQETA